MAKELLVNLLSQAEREAKKILVNLPPQTERAAKEVLIDLPPRAKREAENGLDLPTITSKSRGLKGFDHTSIVLCQPTTSCEA